MQCNAVLTGSQVYGKPTEKSDIDLAVRVDRKTIKKLIAESENMSPESSASFDDSDDPICVSLRFGRLNLLLCPTDKALEVFEKATRFARIRSFNLGRPLSREEAVEIFQVFEAELDPDYGTGFGEDPLKGFQAGKEPVELS